MFLFPLHNVERYMSVYTSVSDLTMSKAQSSCIPNTKSLQLGNYLRKKYFSDESLAPAVYMEYAMSPIAVT